MGEVIKYIKELAQQTLYQRQQHADRARWRHYTDDTIPTALLVPTA